MNGALDTLHIVSLNVVGVFHDKALAILNKLSIAIMASDMHMDRLVFMGKEQENETVLSKQFWHNLSVLICCKDRYYF